MNTKLFQTLYFLNKNLLPKSEITFFRFVHDIGNKAFNPALRLSINFSNLFEDSYLDLPSPDSFIKHVDNLKFENYVTHIGNIIVHSNLDNHYTDEVRASLLLKYNELYQNLKEFKSSYL